MRKPIIVLACTLFLGCAVKSFAGDNKTTKFLQHLEVGTNVIPLVDSLSLNFDNLQVKYFYGKHLERAFRANLYFSDINIIDAKSAFLQYKSRVSFQLGHVWYHELSPKLHAYCATDFKFANHSDNHYSPNPDEFPNFYYSDNLYYLFLSGGLNYHFYKNFSLELETSTSISMYRYYGLDLADNHFHFIMNVFHWNYYPINCITINYRF